MEVESQMPATAVVNNGNKARYPKREILLAMALIAPSLGFIFANQFVISVPRAMKPKVNSTDSLDMSNGTVDFNHTMTTVKPISPINISKPSYTFLDQTVFTQFAPMLSNPELQAKSLEIKLLFFAFGWLGCIVAGFWSDLFGRRFANLSMMSLTVLTGLLACGVSNSIQIFQVFWCLNAIGSIGSHVSTYARLTELLPDSLRLHTCLMVFGTIWMLARLEMLFFAYICKDWYLLIFFLSFHMCMLLLAVNLKPGMILAMVSHRGDVVESAAIDKKASLPSEEDYSIRLVTNFRLLGRMFALCLSFFTGGFILWGFIISRDAYIFSSPYSNFLFTALIDFMAEILAAITCYKTKRTLPVFFFFMACNGICCFIMSGLDSCRGKEGWEKCGVSSKSVEIITHFTSMFSGGACLNITWLLTFSSFPTNMRGKAMGICSSFGRLGGILGIALVDADLIYGSPTALVLVGFLALVTGLSVLFLVPERAAMPLLQTMQQEQDEKDRRLAETELRQQQQTGSVTTMNTVVPDSGGGGNAVNGLHLLGNGHVTRLLDDSGGICNGGAEIASETSEETSGGGGNRRRRRIRRKRAAANVADGQSDDSSSSCCSPGPSGSRP